MSWRVIREVPAPDPDFVFLPTLEPPPPPDDEDGGEEDA